MRALKRIRNDALTAKFRKLEMDATPPVNALEGLIWKDKSSGQHYLLRSHSKMYRRPKGLNCEASGLDQIWHRFKNKVYQTNAQKMRSRDYGKSRYALASVITEFPRRGIDGNVSCRPGKYSFYRDEGKLKHITLIRAQEWLNNQPVNSNRTNTMDKPTLSTIFESYWGSNTHQGYAEIFELATMMSGKSFIHRNYVSVRGTSQGLHIKDLSFPENYRVVKNASIQDELDVLQVYFFKDSECVAMMDIRGRHTKRSVDLYCLTDVFDEFDKCLQDQLLKDEKRVHVASLNEKGEMSVAAEPYFMTPDLMPYDAFYPQLGKPVVQYYDDLLASRNPLTVLMGPPGAGKSTFLRGLINHADLKALMAYDAKLYETTELIKYFYASSYNLLVLEDAELLLEPREHGNGNAAAVLNYLDGVVRYPNKRVVVSCNLSNTSKFEEAVLRVGRCHDVRMFPHLTLQEAILARAAIGRDNDLDLESLGDKIALTNALNYGEDGNFKRHSRAQGIGFGG